MAVMINHLNYISCFKDHSKGNLNQGKSRTTLIIIIIFNTLIKKVKDMPLKLSQIRDAIMDYFYNILIFNKILCLKLETS